MEVKNKAEVRLKKIITTYFVRFFKPREMIEILAELIDYFKTQEAHNLYWILQNAEEKND